jgi:hypothetical protein
MPAPFATALTHSTCDKAFLRTGLTFFEITVFRRQVAACPFREKTFFTAIGNHVADSFGAIPCG